MLIKFLEILVENEFFWILALLILYMRWKKKFEPFQENKPEEITTVEPPYDNNRFDWLGTYLYLSNGREIPAPHIAYYIVALGLEDDPSIRPKTIDKAYYKCLQDVALLQKDQPVKVDIAGLKAARNFLMDRYCYMGFLN